MSNIVKEKKKPSRIYAWSLVTYLPVEVLLAKLQWENIKDFAFIIHDKDKMPNGQPKEYHIHLALILYNATTMSAICKRFSSVEHNAGNCFAEPLSSPKGIYEYFSHDEETDKAIYNKDDIVTTNRNYFENTEYVDDISVLIIDDMLNGTPLRVMYRRYGKNFIYSYRNLKELVEDIIDEERKRPVNTFTRLRRESQQQNEQPK